MPPVCSGSAQQSVGAPPSAAPSDGGGGGGGRCAALTVSLNGEPLTCAPLPSETTTSYGPLCGYVSSTSYVPSPRSRTGGGSTRPCPRTLTMKVSPPAAHCRLSAPRAVMTNDDFTCCAMNLPVIALPSAEQLAATAARGGMPVVLDCARARGALSDWCKRIAQVEQSVY